MSRNRRCPLMLDVNLLDSWGATGASGGGWGVSNWTLNICEKNVASLKNHETLSQNNHNMSFHTKETKKKCKDLMIPSVG